MHEGKLHETRDVVAAVGVSAAAWCAFAMACAAAAAAAVGQKRPRTSWLGTSFYLPGHGSSTKNGSFRAPRQLSPQLCSPCFPPPYVRIRFQRTILLRDHLCSCHPALFPTPYVVMMMLTRMNFSHIARFPESRAWS